MEDYNYTTPLRCTFCGHTESPEETTSFELNSSDTEEDCSNWFLAIDTADIQNDGKITDITYELYCSDCEDIFALENEPE